MNGYPESVTREQVRQALAVLGIPGKDVYSVELDCREGITVRLFVTGEAGKKLVHGGHAVTAELRIPHGEEATDASA